MFGFQYKGIESFHKHLDVCKRCRDRPFDLCSEGGSLLAACMAGAPGLPTPPKKSGDYSKERW